MIFFLWKDSFYPFGTAYGYNLEGSSGRDILAIRYSIKNLCFLKISQRFPNVSKYKISACYLKSKLSGPGLSSWAVEPIGDMLPSLGMNDSCTALWKLLRYCKHDLAIQNQKHRRSIEIKHLLAGQPLTRFGNSCCARFTLLMILCMALSVHWIVSWLHITCLWINCTLCVLIYMYNYFTGLVWCFCPGSTTQPLVRHPPSGGAASDFQTHRHAIYTYVDRFWFHAGQRSIPKVVAGSTV